MIGHFRKHYNSRGKCWDYPSKHFYTVDFIQAPVLVAVSAIILSPIRLESMVNFLLVAVISVPLAWERAYGVRKIPYADRVL